jgi:preprotein translocase subunit Sec63
LKDGTVATAKEIEEWRQTAIFDMADYTRKTQALAEDRKVVDHAVQTFHAQRQQFEQAAQVIQQMAQAVLPTPPDQTLLDRSSDQL